METLVSWFAGQANIVGIMQVGLDLAVIGFVAGRHCLDGHEQRLRTLGVQQIAHDFEEIAVLLA